MEQYCKLKNHHFFLAPQKNTNVLIFLPSLYTKEDNIINNLSVREIKENRFDSNLKLSESCNSYKQMKLK